MRSDRESRDSGYIRNVRRLLRQNHRGFIGAALAGLGLRLLFFAFFPAVTDDSRIYANLGTNWLQHGIYGQAEGGQIVPTDARLPGYPLFLAALFWVFGAGNFRAVMLLQILIDLGTCLIVADLARRVVSKRAAKIAFVLAALCPFLANYAAAALTETLEIFFTAVALDCAAAGFDRMENGAENGIRFWAATGAAIGACILLRPDGGVLLASVLLYLVIFFKATRGIFRRRLVAGIIVAVCALAPLAPWTVRNYRTLHHFQPLAPRYANDSDELVPRGFIRWVKTWIADYVSVEEIYWNVPGVVIDPNKLPTRAFDSLAEKDATLSLIADYNESQDITPDLDARFGAVGDERIAAHPVRYYLQLPLSRVADMWLRPRTELLPPDPRWWEFTDDIKYLALTLGLGLINLAFVAAACWALLWRPSGVRWAGMLVCFLLLRCALLVTLENPEPRYTLECYPVLIVLAASCLAPVVSRRNGDASVRRDDFLKRLASLSSGRFCFFCGASFLLLVYGATELRIGVR